MPPLKWLYAITVLVAASYGTASAASFTSCAVYLNNAIVAQNSGETSCLATFPVPMGPTLISQGNWTQSGPLSFGAATRATAEPDCCGLGFIARTDSRVTASTREDFYFAGAPASSLLRIDWQLLNFAPDTSGNYSFTLAGVGTSGFQYSPQRTELPLAGGQSVAVDTNLNLGCYINSVCAAQLHFVLLGIDLVNASGVSLSGYRYKTGSEGRYAFAGGVYDASIPEPATTILTGSLLLVGGLIGISRRLLQRQ